MNIAVVLVLAAEYLHCFSRSPQALHRCLVTRPAPEPTFGSCHGHILSPEAFNDVAEALHADVDPLQEGHGINLFSPDLGPNVTYMLLQVSFEALLLQGIRDEVIKLGDEYTGLQALPRLFQPPLCGFLSVDRVDDVGLDEVKALDLPKHVV